MAYAPARNAPVSHFRRKPAEIVAAERKPFAVRHGYAKVLSKVMLSSICSITRFLHRYPSHPRPAYSPSRSAWDSCLPNGKSNSAIGYRGKAAHDIDTRRITRDAHEKTTMGSRLCKRHQSSFQQWQHSVWQVALKTTWSAALSARVQGLLPLNCLARIAPVRWLSAPLLACCATTRASLLANRLDNRALSGRLTSGSRQRGLPPLAAFSI